MILLSSFFHFDQKQGYKTINIHKHHFAIWLHGLLSNFVQKKLSYVSNLLFNRRK